jgi:citrate synthase
MSALRAVLSVVALEQPIKLPPAHDDAQGQALRLSGMAPTVVAALHRLRLGQRPVLPRKSLDFATNFLTMLRGEVPHPDAARALDIALILRAENELNPSTFAARVIASTGADLYAGVTGALSALSGPRHGWHSRNVLAALDQIGAPENTEAWVRERLARGGKLPGFGHQVYKGEDPRTALLRALAEQECGRAGMSLRYQVARELESLALRETGQHPVVDFYLAPLYAALGIPVDLFTAVFAISRMPGWVAHLLEQYPDEKLIRPRAEYIGPVGQDYRPIRKRR